MFIEDVFDIAGACYFHFSIGPPHSILNVGDILSMAWGYCMRRRSYNVELHRNEV